MTPQDSGSPGAFNQFDDDLDALADLLSGEGIDASHSTSISPRDPQQPAPMSFSQELLWMLDRATPGLTAYNLPVSRRLRGLLDTNALQLALDALAARHEVLRSRFREENGVPVQVVDPPVPAQLTVMEVSGASDADRLRDAQRIVRERARTPFDLAQEHLFRPTLIRIAPDDHVLVIETHHIVMDGWSIAVVFRELAALYAAARRGRAADLPRPLLQYGDYAAWQRQRLSGERLEQLLSFWRAQLGDATEPLALATDHRRTAATGFTGSRERVVLGAEQADRLKRFAQAQGATLYMVLLSAYATVLHRYTGRNNVLIGSGSAGRTLPETEGIVGYVNNTLVQRADFVGDPSFADLVARVRASTLDAYDHQEVPLEKLVLELRRGDAQRSDAPLFEVVLTMQDVLSAGLTLDDLTVEPFGADLGATKFDITLLVSQRDGSLYITSQYRSELFTAERMQRFLGHLVAVLDSGIATPSTPVSALPMLARAERDQLDRWNETAIDEGRSATLTALFSAAAQRVPQRVAVVAANETGAAISMTYAELDASANRLAHVLNEHGVGAGAAVGLLIGNTAPALVALLGILKSGAAYVPLSVDAPTARIDQQLGECGASIVVTTSELAARVPSRVRSIALDRADDIEALQRSSDAAPVVSLAANAVAYVLFTSGSTGTSKGVAVTHANAVHYARAVSRVMAGLSDQASGDGMAMLDGWQFGLVSTLAADLGNTSLLLSLLAGGSLHILGSQVTTEPERFAAYMKANAIDLLKITPSHLMALCGGRTGRDLAPVLPRRVLVVGGEALRLDVARAVLAAESCRLVNHYGPTETTVGVCTFDVRPESLERVEALGAQTVPIGRVLANTRAYVVDANGSEMPVGVPGELWIGGDGVSVGYIGREDLTRERFVRHRGDRVYRTGDRVRRLDSGDIEYLGRNDDQVKIRGFRVELGEVAQAVRSHPGAEHVVAVLRSDVSGEASLVAYVVPKHSGYAASHTDRASAEEFKAHAATLLPDYMVPSAVVLLDTLPLTANGKVNVAALPAPETAGAGADTFVEPRTDTEKRLAEIWRDVLKRERIGLTDNFLSLGGHSLLAIRVLGRITKSFGVRLALRALFDTPTVEQLAASLEAEQAKAAVAPASVGIGEISRDAYRIGRAVTPNSGGDSSGGTGR